MRSSASSLHCSMSGYIQRAAFLHYRRTAAAAALSHDHGSTRLLSITPLSRARPAAPVS